MDEDQAIEIYDLVNVFTYFEAAADQRPDGTWEVWVSEPHTLQTLIVLESLAQYDEWRRNLWHEWPNAGRNVWPYRIDPTEGPDNADAR
jgi:hypothetical protein